MNPILKFARERVVLDLAPNTEDLGRHRPATFDDLEPDGGPCWPSPPVGTVLPPEIIPADDIDDAVRLPKRVIVRDDGRWCSLEEDGGYRTITIDEFERCDVGSHVNVILTYGGITESGPIYGLFAEASDLFADDPDSVALGSVGAESLTADQRAMALRNSERLG